MLFLCGSPYISLGAIERKLPLSRAFKHSVRQNGFVGAFHQLSDEALAAGLMAVVFGAEGFNRLHEIRLKLPPEAASGQAQEKGRFKKKPNEPRNAAVFPQGIVHDHTLITQHKPQLFFASLSPPPSLSSPFRLLSWHTLKRQSGLHSVLT